MRKLLSLALLVLVPSGVIAVENRCQLISLATSPTTTNLGSCQSSPQNFKTVTFTEGWNQFNPNLTNGYRYDENNPLISSAGICWQNYSCWPAFNTPDYYYEPLY